MGSPHLEEEFIGGDCRSRSPLPKPSKICKNHRREGRGRNLKGVNNGGKNVLKNLGTLGKKPPFYTPSRGMTVGDKMSWTDTFRWRNRHHRTVAGISGKK